MSCLVRVGFFSCRHHRRSHTISREAPRVLGPANRWWGKRRWRAGRSRRARWRSSSSAASTALSAASQPPAVCPHPTPASSCRPHWQLLARRSLTAGAARGAELERMNSSYDSLFEGHMDGAVTGHPGLVQTSISNAVRSPSPSRPSVPGWQPQLACGSGGEPGRGSDSGEGRTDGTSAPRSTPASAQSPCSCSPPPAPPRASRPKARSHRRRRWARFASRRGRGRGRCSTRTRGTTTRRSTTAARG